MSLQLSQAVRAQGDRAMEALTEPFTRFEQVSQLNTEKVLAAFQAHRVSDTMFAGALGYGYNDVGRDTLEHIYADVFGGEAALVRIGFVNGTHAITTALFGALRAGDTLVSATGAPYDTMQGVIGHTRKEPGSLDEYGIAYKEVGMLPNGKPDFAGIEAAVKDRSVRAVLVQRSRGYATRPSLFVEEIGRIAELVHRVNPSAWVVVDNCYGEFVEPLEPTQVGADLVVGSLIKNPGGGLAPSGGYLVGKRELMERAAMRYSAPGIGAECGSSLGQNRLLYQGLFLAPHTVCQALKTATFSAQMMMQLGYEVDPLPTALRTDIIQMLHLHSPDGVRAFCRGIQFGAPVDSYVTPEPWDMPGYDCQVIMAAGAFVQGASIELSADAPMREPYTVFLQGGLTFESGKMGILLAVEQLGKS